MENDEPQNHLHLVMMMSRDDELPTLPSPLGRRLEETSPYRNSDLPLDSISDEDFNQSMTSSSSTISNIDDTAHDHGLLVVGILTISMVIFMVLAIAGNTFVILTVVRHKGMRTRTNMFIVNLAVADILVGIFNMPFSLLTVIYGRWIFGDTFCQFNGFVVPLFCIVSIHTLMYISIHKYISITRPFSQVMTPRKILLMIAASWIWSSVCATTTLSGGNHVIYKKGSSQCGPSIPDEPNEFIHSITITTCNYIIPLSVMSFCYYNIFREIHAHMIRIRETSNVDLQNSLDQQRRITCTLFLVLTCFVVCWTPFIVYSTSAAFMKNKEAVPLLANPVAYWCGYMNSACNPIIYAFRSPSFRQGYREIMCGKGAYLIGGSLATRPSISPYGTLRHSPHLLSSPATCGKAVLINHLCRHPLEDTLSGAIIKRRNQKPILAETNWVSLPILPLRGLRKELAQRVEAVGNSHGANDWLCQQRNLLREALCTKNQENIRRASADGYVDTKVIFPCPSIIISTEDTLLQSVTLPRSSETGSSFKLGNSFVSKSEGDVLYGEEEVVDKRNTEEDTSLANPSVSVYNSEHQIENYGNKIKNRRQPDCPSVVVNLPSLQSSAESLDEGDPEDVNDPQTPKSPTISACLSINSSPSFLMRLGSESGEGDGECSPPSTKSLEMGRMMNSEKQIAKMEDAYKKRRRRKKKRDKLDSPLYSASHEQLMKWMSQDCLDRLETVERDFQSRMQQWNSRSSFGMSRRWLASLTKRRRRSGVASAITLPCDENRAVQMDNWMETSI